MKKLLFISFATALLATCVIAPAMAAVTKQIFRATCDDAPTMHDRITREYSEAPVAFGTVLDIGFMQIYKSDKGTWTVTYTKTDGTMCILAGGDGWEDIDFVSPINGPDA